MPWEVKDGATSADGTILPVVHRLSGKIQCPECDQKFDSEKAVNLHSKFIHQSNGVSPINAGYELRYEFDRSQLIEGNDHSFGMNLRSASKL